MPKRLGAVTVGYKRHCNRHLPSGRQWLGTGWAPGRGEGAGGGTHPPLPMHFCPPLPSPASHIFLLLPTSSANGARGSPHRPAPVPRAPQVGTPTSNDQYLHRIGRTPRADSPALHAVLLLADFEGPVLRHMRGFGLKRAPAPAIDDETQAMLDYGLEKLAPTQLGGHTRNIWVCDA